MLSIRRRPKYLPRFTLYFSGLAFIGIASLIVAPFVHRILHRFNLDRE
jgi:hypothetical protein